MIARLLSVSMFTTGVAVFGLVGYMQYDPLAFTTGSRVATSPVPVIPVAVPESVPEPEAPALIELAPFLIEGRAQPKPRAAPAAVQPAALPCSDWRELGPTYVEGGEGSGMQRVRALCPPEPALR